MTVPRTDLALEAADDLAARAKKFSLPEGIQRLESLQEGYPVTDIRVTGDGARTLGKPGRPLYHRRPDPLLSAAAGVFSPRRLVHRLSAARPAASRGAPLSGPGSGAGQPCHDPRRHRPHRRGEPAGDTAHGPRTAPPVPGFTPGLCPVHRRTGPHGAGDAGADTGCGGPHPARRRHRHRRPGRPQPPAAMRHGAAQRHRPDPRLRCGQPPPRRGPQPLWAYR